MRIIDVEQNTDEWLEARKGKITGSKLKNLVVKRGSSKKIGFYQLIADRLSLDNDLTSSRERGHSLEHEAIKQFESEYGKKVNKDIGICVHDDYPNIALSPDGLIKNDDKYTEAVEVKCLSTANHIEAVLTNKLPSEFRDQSVQYFIVNDDLELLHFVFYDPRLLSKPLHVIEVWRTDIQEDIDDLLQYEKAILKEIDDAVAKLAF